MMFFFCLLWRKQKKKRPSNIILDIQNMVRFVLSHALLCLTQLTRQLQIDFHNQRLKNLCPLKLKLGKLNERNNSPKRHYKLTPMLMDSWVKFSVHKTFLAFHSKTELQHSPQQLVVAWELLL